MDWSQLGCGARGHVTYVPDEPGLRDRLGVTTRAGPAWRCLRCGTFVLGEPGATGPAADAPSVRRGAELRSALILRIFAVERFIRALLVAAIAVAVWRFSVSRQSLEQAYDNALPPLKALLRDLGFSVQHSKVLGLINRAFTTDPRILGYLAIGLAAYAVIEVIEGTGLWLLKRWGEYFAMIATSIGLPYEVYDLAHKVTPLRLVAFGINLALVVYLVVAKRLFGVRGGKKAYEARRRGESIMAAEITALAAGRQAQDAARAPTRPGAPVGPAPPPGPEGPPGEAAPVSTADPGRPEAPVTDETDGASTEVPAPPRRAP